MVTCGCFCGTVGPPVSWPCRSQAYSAWAGTRCEFARLHRRLGHVQGSTHRDRSRVRALVTGTMRKRLRLHSGRAGCQEWSPEPVAGTDPWRPQSLEEVFTTQSALFAEGRTRRCERRPVWPGGHPVRTGRGEQGPHSTSAAHAGPRASQ